MRRYSSHYSKRSNCRGVSRRSAVRLQTQKRPDRVLIGPFQLLIVGLGLDEVAEGFAFGLEVRVETHLVDAADGVGAELAADVDAKLGHIEVLVVDIRLEPAIGAPLGEGDIATECGRLAGDGTASRHGQMVLLIETRAAGGRAHDLPDSANTRKARW